MFDLFKRKPAPKPEAPADAPPPDTDVSQPAAAAPPDTPSPEAGAATMQPMPAAAPEALAGEKRSWRDRLKAGLGLSRDKLSGALTGVFRRRVLDDEALDELESAL